MFTLPIPYVLVGGIAQQWVQWYQLDIRYLTAVRVEREQR